MIKKCWMKKEMLHLIYAYRQTKNILKKLCKLKLIKLDKEKESS